MKVLSFVIPVFQNSGSLEKTYQAIVNNTPQGYDYEIIFVDDGSTDGSLSELKNIHYHDEKVKIIVFSRNFGQSSALIAGFKECKGDALITLSADLQDPAENIPLMIKEWECGYEIVICYRNDREDSAFARVGSHFFYSIIKKSVKKMPEGGFDFLLLDKKAYEEYNLIRYRNRFFQGDILWLGYNVNFIPYKRLKREFGKSQWSFTKKIKYLVDGILNTAYWPIRFMSLLGFLFAFLGFIYASLVVYAKFVNQTPFKGYAPIVILLLIIGGLIMLMLGVIGEYIWRIYDETKQKPHYIIKEKYG